MKATRMLAAAALACASSASPAADVAPALNGIALPAGYKDWRVIAPPVKARDYVYTTPVVLP